MLPEMAPLEEQLSPRDDLGTLSSPMISWIASDMSCVDLNIGGFNN